MGQEATFPWNTIFKLMSVLSLWWQVHHSFAPWLWGWWFSRPQQSWGESLGNAASKTLRSAPFLLILSHFSLNNCTSESSTRLVNFCNYGTVYFDYFYQCCCCACGVEAFQRSALCQSLMSLSRRSPFSGLVKRWEKDSVLQKVLEKG